MAKKLDVQLVVKHITNGTFGENLCRICLLPLTDLYENIFTKVCKENEEHCIADILRELCGIQFLDDDHYNVCSKCFTSAWNAYKFYLKTRYNDELLHLYTDNILFDLDSIEISNKINNESIFLSLPIISPDVPTLNSDPSKVCIKKEDKLLSDSKIEANDKKGTIDMNKKLEIEVSIKPITQSNKPLIAETAHKPLKIEDDDDELVIIMNENGQPSFFKMQPDGQLLEVEYDDRCRNAYRVITEELPRRRVHKKKREPMTFKKCSRCPIEYRFVAKLREHMWLDHGILLYSCKICKALVEDEDEYLFHMKTHTNEYQCEICNNVFKKRETIISHLALHDKIQQNMKTYVCKECGKIMKDEESFKLHVEEHNLKQYTCYYCGRMYKKEIGFNNHIRKHEMYMKTKESRQKQGEKRSGQGKQKIEQHKPEQKQAHELTCEVCGRIILSERALLWHRRLHTNERPFTCKVCGRGFVSLNRCKQHALCAHTAPSRRCPLCPALFHMRSMVNSHIKKVHLKAHKRRTRAVRQQEVFWHTETVPIQELSVAIQSDILELQAARQNASEDGMFVD